MSEEQQAYSNKDYIIDLVLRSLRFFVLAIAFYAIAHNLESYRIIAAAALISTGAFGLLSILIKRFGVEHQNE